MQCGLQKMSRCCFRDFLKMSEFTMKQFKGVAELFVNLDIAAVPNEIRNDIIQRALK